MLRRAQVGHVRTVKFKVESSLLMPSKGHGHVNATSKVKRR